MNNKFQKFIIWVITIVLFLEPVFSIIPTGTAKAADSGTVETDNTGEGYTEPIPSPVDMGNYGITPFALSEPDQPATTLENTPPIAYNDLVDLVAQYTGTNSYVTTDDLFSSTSDARIIIKQSDLNLIKTLDCLGSIMPDFNENYQAIYSNLPDNQREEIDAAVGFEVSSSATEKRYVSADQYLYFLHFDSNPETRVANHNLFSSYRDSAKSNYMNQGANFWQSEWAKLAKNPADNASSLLCFADALGQNKDQFLTKIQNNDTDFITNAVDKLIDASQIDIRIIKTLVYLVTPKDQGGAGHWRIRIQKLFQSASRPYSTESDQTLATINGNAAAKTVPCDGMTAADCGIANDAATASDASVIAEESDGTQYEGYLQKADQAESVALVEKNISAHTSGQAVDISEVDDIRCTMIKHHRVGDDDNIPQPIRPIKLAWQTTEGYAESGGLGEDANDMMNMMKTMASSYVMDLISSMGGDPTVYSGDLSQANYQDILSLIGESLFGYILGSPNHTLQGFDMESTMQSLGQVYIADYLGLDRDIFSSVSLNSGSPIELISDVNAAIGEAAVEDRLKLPHGSLSSLNYDQTKILNKETRNLEGTLTNIGQRKLEYEMNLDQGDLDGFVSDDGATTLSDTDLQALVGLRVFEKAMSLARDDAGSAAEWLADYSGFANHASIRIPIMQNSPGYVDSLLHVATGTTQAFMDDQKGAKTMTPSSYIRQIGKKRLDDTVYGLTYFSMNDDAYSVPSGTWESALKGNRNALETIGVYTLGRMIGESSTFKIPEDDKALWAGKTLSIKPDPDMGLEAMRQWLQSNLTSTGGDSCKVKSASDFPKVTVTNNVYEVIGRAGQVQTEVLLKSYPTEVTISESKLIGIGLEQGDIFRMFGCAEANGQSVYERLGGELLASAFTDNGDKSGTVHPTVDTLDATPGDGNFYVKRLTTITNSFTKLVNDWSGDITDPEMAATRDHLESLAQGIPATALDGLDLLTGEHTILALQQKVRSITHDIDTLKDDYRYLYSKYNNQGGTTNTEANGWITKINTSILDLNKILLAMQEIMSGREIKATDQITIDKISPAKLKNGPNKTTTGSSAQDGSATADGTKASYHLTAQMIFDLFSGNIDFSKFIFLVGAGITEANMNLPPNSLVYFVQNFEKRGFLVNPTAVDSGGHRVLTGAGLENSAVSAREAFYQAVGQARIEQEFKMPLFYFQGYEPETMPDFSHDMSAIVKYNEAAVKDYYNEIKSRQFNTWLDLTGQSKELTIDKISVSTPAAWSSLSIRPASTTTVYPYFDDLQKTASDTVKQMNDSRINLNIPPEAADYYSSASKEAVLAELSKLKQADRKRFNQLKGAALSSWKNEYNETIKSQGGMVIKEASLDDIMENIRRRGFTDNIRTPEQDLLMRMGIPGQYEALKENSPLAIGASNSRFNTIDDKLSLAEGTTKSLFTNIYTEKKSIGLNDKKTIESKLSWTEGTGENTQRYGLSKLAVDKFVSLVNGDITLADLASVGIVADYVSNPYVENKPFGYDNNDSTTETCPIVYKVESTGGTGGSYQVNNKSLENDTFCYYDKKGRHCFESNDMADRYALNHKEDQFTDVLDQIAYALVGAMDLPYLHEVRQGLEDFIKDPQKTTIFSTTVTDQFDVQRTVPSNVDPNYWYTVQEFNKIGTKYNFDPAILINLFTRESFDAPLSFYKRKVGVRTLETTVLDQVIGGFSDLISVGGAELSDIIDADDIFDILMGNNQVLLRIATRAVDTAMEVTKGTTYLYYTALTNIANPRAWQCALSQAGGSMLGSILGLNYVPIKGHGVDNFVENVGESKIEEALGLPRGSFFGSDINEIARNVKEVNFAYTFHLPVASTIPGQLDNQEIISDNDLTAILGSEGQQFQDSTARYKLTKIRDYLLSSNGLTIAASQAVTGLSGIDDNIVLRLSSIQAVLKSNAASLIPDFGTTTPPTNLIEYKNEVVDFFSYLNFIDTTLGLESNSTSKLLSGMMTPDSYRHKVGLAQLGTVAWNQAEKIGERSGISASQIEAAADIFNNMNNVFVCASTNHVTTVNGKDACLKPASHTDANAGYYHNWSKLYETLNTIYPLKFTQNTNLRPETVRKIIQDPSLAGKTLLEEAAWVYDNKYGLNEKTTASFSGMLRYLFSPTNDDPHFGGVATARTAENSCDATFAGQGEALQVNLANRKQELEDLKQDSTADWGELWLARGKVTEAEAAIKTLNDAYLKCQVDARPDPTQPQTQEDSVLAGAGVYYIPKLLSWAKEAAAETIKIELFGAMTIDGESYAPNMPIEDIRAIFDGNFGNLGYAVLSTGVNLVTIGIDHIQFNNCSESEKSLDGKECNSIVPSGMRISYPDIKMAFEGDPAADAEAQNLAIWSVEGNVVADPTLESPGSTATGTANNALSLTIEANQTPPVTDPVTNNVDTLKRIYHYPTDINYDPNAYFTTLQNREKEAEASCGAGGFDSLNPEFSNCVHNYYAQQSGWISSTGLDPSEQIEKINRNTFAIKGESRKHFSDNLQYKVMDAALWKLDDNIFPGFAQQLLKGNATARVGALTTYIKNGLESGHLMGAQFDALKNVEGWADVFAFSTEIGTAWFNQLAGNITPAAAQVQRESAFTTFVDRDKGFTTLTNFIGQKSEDWFGFSITSDMAKGLITGLSTGDFGFGDISADTLLNPDGWKDLQHTTPKAVGGKTVPTVGSAVLNWGVNRIFAWADKKLGLDAGTTYQIASKGYAVYKSYKEYAAATQAVADLRKWAGPTGAAEAIAEGEQAASAAKLKLQAAEYAFITYVIDFAIAKLFGEQMAAFDQKNNLAPGTTSMLVSTAVSYGVAVTLFHGTAIAAAAGPAAIASLGMILMMNVYAFLWGTYKIEIICTPDHYFPRITSPDSSSDDISGITWGNRVDKGQEVFAKANQLNSITVAQYKARALLGDLLSMQYSFRFRDENSTPLVPTQIMTGRQEDVDYWNNLIDTNVCKQRLGNNAQSINGVCNGDTRLGVWSNAQTVAWTHIGF